MLQQPFEGVQENVLRLLIFEFPDVQDPADGWPRSRQNAAEEPDVSAVMDGRYAGSGSKLQHLSAK